MIWTANYFLGYYYRSASHSDFSTHAYRKKHRLCIWYIKNNNLKVTSFSILAVSILMSACPKISAEGTTIMYWLCKWIWYDMVLIRTGHFMYFGWMRCIQIKWQLEHQNLCVLVGWAVVPVPLFHAKGTVLYSLTSKIVLNLYFFKETTPRVFATCSVITSAIQPCCKIM